MLSLEDNNVLTKEKIEFYRENGFVQVDNVLTEDEVIELRSHLEEVMATNNGLSIQTDTKGGAYYRVLNQRVNTWRDHGGMAKFVFNPRFSNLAHQLTGSNGIRLFHDQALLKMPGDSKPTPWHQDFPYWPMNKEAAEKTISIWIALDDVDEQNGCMMFLPKSHKAGQLKPINLAEPEDLFEYAQGSGLEEKKPVIVRMKAGSCTFHNGLTFHYAFANQTDKPRRAFVIIFMPDGTTFNGKPHPVTSDLSLEKDVQLKAGLFPLLSKA